MEPSFLAVLFAGLSPIVWTAVKTLGGEAVKGMVGGAADDARKRLQAIVLQRIKAQQGLPQNHDLAKGLRSAQLEATSYLLETAAASTREANPAKAFLASARKRLQAARREIDQLNWSPEFEATLMHGFEAAMSSAALISSGQAGVSGDEIAATATELAWAELIDWAPETSPPPGLKERFFGTIGEVSWWTAFSAAATEQLKTAPRFRDAFFAGKLIEIGGRRIDGDHVWGEMQASTAALADDMAAVLRKLDDIQTIAASTYAKTETIEALLRENLSRAHSGAHLSQSDVGALATIGDFAAGRIGFSEALRKAPSMAAVLADLHDRLDSENRDARAADLRSVAEAVQKIRSEDERLKQQGAKAAIALKRFGIVVAALTCVLIFVSGIAWFRSSTGLKMDSFTDPIPQPGFAPGAIMEVFDSNGQCLPRVNLDELGFSRCRPYSEAAIDNVLKIEKTCWWATCRSAPTYVSELKDSLRTVLRDPVMAGKEAFMNYCLTGQTNPIVDRRERFQGLLSADIADRRENWGHDGNLLEPHDEYGNPTQTCRGTQMADAGDEVLVPAPGYEQRGVAACRPIPETERRAYCGTVWNKVEEEQAQMRRLAGRLGVK